jgi:beta-glucosidase
LCLAKMPPAFSFITFQFGASRGIRRILTVKTCQSLGRIEFWRGTAPRLALTCIQRVHLNAGETRELKFSLEPAQMSFVDLAGKRAIRPGSYRLFVGGAQPQLDQDKGVVFRILGEKALEF